MSFFVAMEQKFALNPFGGTLGGNGGPGKIISPLAGSVGLHDSPLSILDLRATCTVFPGVRHVCHDNDGSFCRCDADPGIQGYRH